MSFLSSRNSESDNKKNKCHRQYESTIIYYSSGTAYDFGFSWMGKFSMLFNHFQASCWNVYKFQIGDNLCNSCPKFISNQENSMDLVRTSKTFTIDKYYPLLWHLHVVYNVTYCLKIIKSNSIVEKTNQFFFVVANA